MTQTSVKYLYVVYKTIVRGLYNTSVKHAVHLYLSFIQYQTELQKALVTKLKPITDNGVKFNFTIFCICQFYGKHIFSISDEINMALHNYLL